ncbi:uncharacterized protein LOC134310099 [Trichomycterus rosablanca]|uniref:uncharacterized protein LOC134310099 n=1 Tax=Trichomycterus rosablanca TaxID=2290929 RepID=UPI002F35D3A9
MLSMPQRPVCGLAPLIVGLFCLAQTISASECEKSFYKNTPPQRVTESGLERRCHSLGDGRQFVSLYHPESQANVYTALRVGQHNAWGKGTKEGKDETDEKSEESKFYIPALYKRDQNAAPSDSASPLQKLDTHTAKLVKSKTVPRCSDAEGDVYVQSGVGGLKGSQEGVLWSAVCCAVPNGQGSFSMGVVQDDHKNLKVMSIEELEKLVGVKELFAGGCGHSEGLADLQHLTDEKEVVSDSEEEQEIVETDDSDVEEEERAETAVQKSVKKKASSKTEQIDESGVEESANATESLILNALSTSMSLLISPVVSTLTNIPSQVGFVLQKDAAVLASLPMDSVRLVRNLGSGVAKGVENVGSVAYHVTEHSVCSLYDFTSTLTGTLLSSCYEGLAGTGTLTCDILGLATDTLVKVLDLGTGIGGSACRSLGGFVGSVGSEMGQQGSSVGQGVGTLIWRGMRGVGNVFGGVLSIIGGVVGNTVENVREAFREE